MILKQLKYVISTAVLMTTVNATDEGHLAQMKEEQRQWELVNQQRLKQAGIWERLRKTSYDDVEANAQLKKESRQWELADQQRLKLWDEPGSFSSPLTMMDDADIWRAFYGIKAAPLVDGRFIISNGVTVRLPYKGYVIQGQLVSVSAKKTVFVYDNDPNYPDELTSTPSSWEELRKDMQASQLEKGRMSVSRNLGKVDLEYSFGNALCFDSSYEYRIQLHPTNYVNFSQEQWGNGVEAVTPGVFVQMEALKSLWLSLRPKVLIPSLSQAQGDQSAPQMQFNLAEPFRVIIMNGNVLLAQGKLIALRGTSVFLTSSRVYIPSGPSNFLVPSQVDKREETPIPSVDSLVSEILSPCAQSEKGCRTFSVEEVNGLCQVKMAFDFSGAHWEAPIAKMLTLILDPEGAANSSASRMLALQA